MILMRKKPESIVKILSPSALYTQKSFPSPSNLTDPTDLEKDFHVSKFNSTTNSRIKITIPESLRDVVQPNTAGESSSLRIESAISLAESQPEKYRVKRIYASDFKELIRENKELKVLVKKFMDEAEKMQETIQGWVKIFKTIIASELNETDNQDEDQKSSYCENSNTEIVHADPLKQEIEAQTKVSSSIRLRETCLRSDINSLLARNQNNKRSLEPPKLPEKIAKLSSFGTVFIRNSIDNKTGKTQPTSSIPTEKWEVPPAVQLPIVIDSSLTNQSPLEFVDGDIENSIATKTIFKPFSWDNKIEYSSNTQFVVQENSQEYFVVEEVN